MAPCKTPRDRRLCRKDFVTPYTSGHATKYMTNVLSSTSDAELPCPSPRLEGSETVKDCKQLQFNDDGSLLYRLASNEVEVYDTRSRKVALRTQCLDWLLQFMPPQDNQMILSCRENKNRGWVSRFQLWDLRYSGKNVGNIYSSPRAYWDFAHHSNQDDIILAEGGRQEKCFLFYDTKSFTTSEAVEPISELSGWSQIVSNCSLAPDEATLVMNTDYNFYIIIRDLCLQTFAEDLKAYQPLKTVTEHFRLDSDSFEQFPDYKDHIWAESLAASDASCVWQEETRRRNRPEIMLHQNWPLMELGGCQDLVISPTGDYFLGQGSTSNAELLSVYNLQKTTASPNWSTVGGSTARQFVAAHRLQDTNVARISPDGAIVAVYDSVGSIGFYAAPCEATLGAYGAATPMRVIHTIESETVYDFAFSPNRSTFVLANKCGELKWYSSPV